VGSVSFWHSLKRCPDTKRLGRIGGAIAEKV
jgi:hypothetical protein